MGNTFRYKDFDFYVFMYGMFGHTIYCDPGTAHDGRMNTRYVDYWTPENPNSHFRKPQKGDADQANYDAYWYNKGDFVRISDITLGYSLPKKLINYAGLEGHVSIYKCKILSPSPAILTMIPKVLLKLDVPGTIR